MSRWWRAYDDAVDNAKLLLLSDRAHRAWFNLLCLASANNGVLPAMEIICLKLRMNEKKAGEVIEELIARELLDEYETSLRPHDWNERQFKSDVTDSTNAERQRRYRDRHRVTVNTVTDTVTVTATRDRVQNTDTETESKKEKKEDAALRADAPGVPPKRARKPSIKGYLPDDWLPSSDGPLTPFGREELAKMRDWAKSNAIAKADWDATFRNWLRRAGEHKPRGFNGRESSGQGVATTGRERFADALAKLKDSAERLQSGEIHEGGGNVIGLLPHRRSG